MIASTLGWWADAGVDTVISETPRDWLAPPAPPPAIIAPAARTADSAPPPVTTALPNDLAALHTLLAEGAYAPAAAPPRLRVTPSGDPASGLMVIADMPDAPDVAARHLLAGETQRLFDAMLVAMGRTRDTIYLAALSPARISGGRIDSALAAPLAALMRRHIALVAPRAIMLLGDETCRALLGIERGQARGEPDGALRQLNHDGGTVPAIAIVHPRFLLRHPAAKADAWTEMRRLIGVFAS
jgi:DNA polymerase